MGIANTSSSTIVSVNERSGELVSDKLAIANEFNGYFSSIGSHLANQISKLGSNQLYFEPQFFMRLKSFTERKNNVIISAPQNKIFAQTDVISNRIAKASLFAIVPFLKQSLNYPLN